MKKTPVVRNVDNTELKYLYLPRGVSHSLFTLNFSAGLNLDENHKIKKIAISAL